MADVAGFEPGYWDDAQRLARENLLMTGDYLKAFPGTYQITALVPEMPQPLGAVWIRFEGDTTISVLNSWVFEPVRRCGVRSAMHRHMLAIFPSCDRVVTGLSTLDGRAWMQANGYTRTKDGWELIVQREPKTPSKSRYSHSRRARRPASRSRSMSNSC